MEDQVTVWFMCETCRKYDPSRISCIKSMPFGDFPYKNIETIEMRIRGIESRYKESNCVSGNNNNEPDWHVISPEKVIEYINKFKDIHPPESKGHTTKKEKIKSKNRFADIDLINGSGL